MVEILAPAGNENCAYAAINSGANALYLGLTSFSARASADNFDFASLKKLAAYAHALGVRVHVAMNTLVKEKEREQFVRDAVSAYNAGADALIIQDMFLGKYIKECCPQITLHLSTQSGVNNVYGARLAAEYGFSRVILSRETPLDDIKRIASFIETEVFVQGALCTCFSGQCYMSSFAGGNSGNRGRCKQPCRKKYSIDREGFSDSAYRLSLSDLSVGESIDELVKAGVASFKIEGRMRRPEYVSAAVKYYKKLLGGGQASSELSALRRTYNRGNYTKGLAFGQDKTFISSAVQGHIGEYCGVVKVIGGKFVCLGNSDCAEGDAFKILRSGKEVGGASYGGAYKGGFVLSSSTRLMNGDKVFITTDASLNKQLLSGKKLRAVTLSASVVSGQKIVLWLDGEEYTSDFICGEAVNRAATAEDIVKCFDKTDAYPFAVEYGDIQIVGNPFVPASALNSFRREVYARYYEKLTARPQVELKEKLFIPEKDNAVNRKVAVIASDLRCVRADIGILHPDYYFHINPDAYSSFSGEKFIYLPPYLSTHTIEQLKPTIAAFDGIYCDGYYSVALARELGLKLFAGSGFNAGNSLSLSYIKADYIALSKELTHAEAHELARSNTFCLSAGNIKVMDIIYCPFSKTCKSCDKRGRYILTDEAGRQFALRRYRTDDCRFELYNCANLVAPQKFTGILADLTLESAAEVAQILSDERALKEYFKNYTSGHSKNAVL